MVKIAMIGAGSTIFMKNILGDSMLTPSLQDAEYSLYDINPSRLEESRVVLTALNESLNQNRAKITCHCGVEHRKEALRGADFIINTFRQWDFTVSEPIDFGIPAKYGLRQTIADTLGIGGLFRALGAGEEMLHFAEDIAEVCPNVWFLNYVNPMCILTGLMQKHTPVKTIGLCHSFQGCVPSLLETLGLKDKYDEKKFKYTIAGINHQAWLLDLFYEGRDVYPEIKDIAFRKLDEWIAAPLDKKSDNMVRLEVMRKFGYYVTESSEHTSEYQPYWIKRNYPELIERYNIPLDASPNRCRENLARWEKQYAELCKDLHIVHEHSLEFGSGIMNAIVTNTPYSIAGNLLNHGFIENLPADAVVEVPCLVDRNGIHGTYVGKLPVQLAALNMTNINMQQIATEAIATHSREKVYQAAFLDPHASAEMSLDDIIRMVDEMFEAHKTRLPEYK